MINKTVILDHEIMLKFLTDTIDKAYGARGPYKKELAYLFMSSENAEEGLGTEKPKAGKRIFDVKKYEDGILLGIRPINGIIIHMKFKAITLSTQRRSNDWFMRVEADSVEDLLKLGLPIEDK